MARPSLRGSEPPMSTPRRWSTWIACAVPMPRSSSEEMTTWWPRWRRNCRLRSRQRKNPLESERCRSELFLSRCRDDKWPSLRFLSHPRGPGRGKRQAFSSPPGRLVARDDPSPERRYRGSCWIIRRAARASTIVGMADERDIELEPDEYLDRDLVGCVVFDPSGSELGTVQRVGWWTNSLGAHSTRLTIGSR